MNARSWLYDRSGLSVVELLVSVTIMLVTLSIYFTSTILFQKQNQRQLETIESTSETYVLLETLKRDLAAASTITALGGTKGFQLIHNFSDGSSKAVNYTIVANQTNCGGTIRKTFTCTKISRTQSDTGLTISIPPEEEGGEPMTGMAYDFKKPRILLVQTLGFKWCVPATTLGDAAIGPNCADLASLSAPAVAKNVPRRFLGRIEIPRGSSTQSLVIPFIFGLEGLAWGGRSSRIERPP